MSICAALLANSSSDRATKHPFLQHAGAGTLPPRTLCQWLQQDIHYTRAYIRFMGGLLSKLHLPATLLDSSNDAASAQSKERLLMQRVFDLVVFALNNIQREMGFFEDVIRQYKLQVFDGAEPATRAYQDFFASVGGSGATLLEGLVALWGTEWCYLNAWQYAASHLPAEEQGDESAANAALRKHFIPNWTSPEFQDFVSECEGVLDAVAEHAGVHESGDDRGSSLREKCEEVFRQILWLEGGFWPDVQTA